jgi:hypothetical protein
MEIINEMIVRFLEKHCKDGKEWKEMESDLLLLVANSLDAYKDLRRPYEPMET